jgi:hypothetical protein
MYGPTLLESPLGEVLSKNSNVLPSDDSSELFRRRVWTGDGLNDLALNRVLDELVALSLLLLCESNDSLKV